MMNFSEISNLQRFILSRLDPVWRIPLEELCLETFLYDGVFNLEKERKLIQPRLDHISIDKRGKIQELAELQDKVYDVVRKADEHFAKNPLIEYVDRLHPMETGVLREVYIFSNIHESLSRIFPGMKKLSLNTDRKSFEELLEFVADFLRVTLSRENFRTENFSKSMMVANMFLSVLKLPEIVIYHRDRARFLRSLDSKTAFDKEFSLTILNFLHKIIATEIFPEMDISIEDLKREKGVSNTYVPIGYSWYERKEDGELLMHTYRDYKVVDDLI